MSYCDYCDGMVVPKEKNGEVIGFCTDCGKIMDSSQTFHEKENIDARKILVTKGINLVKCPFCTYEVENNKYFEYYMDIHKSEEHPKESEIEKASIDELIEFTNSNNYDHAILALSIIEEDEDLEEVLQVSENWKIRLEAVNRINDQNILLQTIFNDVKKEIKIHASKNINDEEISRKIIEEISDADIIAKVISNIHDQSLLTDIILKIPRQDIWINAIDNISNQNFLSKIANNSTEIKIVSVAIKKIYDNKILLDIMQNSKMNITEVCINSIDSIDNITEENILSDFVIYSQDIVIREEAMKLINNEQILEKIVLNGKFIEIQKKAIMKIKNIGILRKIIDLDIDIELRILAVTCIDDTEELKKLAKDNDTIQLSFAAIEKLDEDNLISIIKNSKSVEIKKYALNFIDNQSILRNVAIDNPILAIDVIERITHRDHLMELVIQLDDVEVQKKAIMKINIIPTLNTINKKITDPIIKEYLKNRIDYLERYL